jgi:molybdopterin converting factor small subunit
MLVTVHCFARVGELLGNIVQVELDDPATVADLRQRLSLCYPHCQDLFGRSAVAVNRRIASEDEPIPLEAEVALIPPVSGG